MAEVSGLILKAIGSNQLTNAMNTASVQCLDASGRQSVESRCEPAIYWSRVPLRLYPSLHIYRVPHPARHRLSVQRPGTKKVGVGVPLPGVHGPCNVRSRWIDCRQKLTSIRTTFQWLFWGYSLTYSRDGGPFIGTLKVFGLMDVMVAPSPGSAVLPELVFCLFQLLFCACTVRTR